MEKMTSNRPYLIRAIYEWIVDNELTPYVVIHADLLGVRVPKEAIKEGRIVLNISPKAVRNLVLSNHSASFDARFSGKGYKIHAPINAVEAIYAKENGSGMVFDASGEEEEPEDKSFLKKTGRFKKETKKKPPSPPNLTIIK